MIDKIDFNHTFEDSLNRRSIELQEASVRLIGEYFYALLCKNEHVNLTGYHKIEDFVDFHLLDAIELMNIVNPSDNDVIYDIGSGAGIPGILLNMLKPDITVIMIETSRKKADFIQQVIEELKLDKCQIINSRAEDAAHSIIHREKGDIALARAVGSLSATLELTVGFVKQNGQVLLPRGVGEDIARISDNPAKVLGCMVQKVVKYKLPGRDKEFNAVIFSKTSNLSQKYPRKPGQIKKQPL